MTNAFINNHVNDFEEFGSKEKGITDTYDETVKQKSDVHSYKFIHASKLEEGEVPLGKVIGHGNQKKEILSVIDWFKRSKELKAKGVSIPIGVILFGDPGNGKSLLIKEIIRCCECPVLLFQGNNPNIVEGINETFKKAREIEHSIIVIDELDLLIDKERRVIRALQENLDGVESKDDILVLTATNSMEEISPSLKRSGRLEKLICVPYPNEKECLEVFLKFFKEFNLKIPEDFDSDEVALSLDGISCAGIKSVVNDLVLRNGFENISLEMIYDSIFNVVSQIKGPQEEDNIDVAIHEAGHAVVAKAFPEYFTINRLYISNAGGEFHAREVSKGFWPYKKYIAHIKISMAGILSQKIICGDGSRGCNHDLQVARSYAYQMINLCGYSSCWETLPIVSERSRTETFIKRRNNERKIEKVLRKCENETIKYIKKHRAQIINLANVLFEKKQLKSSEIIAAIN